MARYTLANYINGVLVAPIEGKYLDSLNPATGEVLANVPDSTSQARGIGAAQWVIFVSGEFCFTSSNSSGFLRFSMKKRGEFFAKKLPNKCR